MSDSGQSMVSFLGAKADRRLLGEDMSNLPDAEHYRETAISTREHDRLVAIGSLMTGTTLVGGALIALAGAGKLLFDGGGVVGVAALIVGIVLVATHWGWVHVAEYVGVGIDDRQERGADERRQDWLASIEPYPRFSVSTRVLDDASTRIERFLHRPVLTEQHTFTFVREPDGEETLDRHASAESIATGVETMRRQARLASDRQRGLWEAASTAYDAALINSHDEQRQLAAERAAATALSEHINRSLLEPPLVE
ncbi:MAG TPA: hypothetical protein VHX88_08665 [Solirubrobacteraceae bacterium]|jgi:hypothetical protein|nr:hypothetical protein [Solirubrobacteraceae bacterium]